jgi:hypothetical protein
MGKWCFFSWRRSKKVDYADESVLWGILQSDKSDKKTIADFKMVDAWAKSKSARADELQYRYKSAPSEDSIHVRAGYANVSHKELTTSSLVCCCAFSFTFGGKNFLAHVNPESSPANIANYIEEEFNIDRLRKDDNFLIVMWCGTHRDKEFAQLIVKATLERLELEHKLINTTFIDGIDEYSNVGVNIHGTFSKQIIPQSWKSADAIIVRQDTAIVSNKELLTDRLLGFSAVGFTDGVNNFLALVDNLTRVATIVSAIENNFNIDKLKADDKFTIVLWITSKTNELLINKIVGGYSHRTIKSTLKKLGLEAKINYWKGEISEYSEVGVNVTDGPFCEVVSIAQRKNLLSRL